MIIVRDRKLEKVGKERIKVASFQWCDFWLRYWPWWVSLLLHVVFLFILSMIVFISFSPNQQRRQIVPSTNIGRVEKVPLFQRLELNFTRIDDNPLDDRDFPQRLSKGAQDDQKKLSILSSDKSHELLSLETLTRPLPAQPALEFFSCRGNAYSVIYLVDRSASMIDVFYIVKRELKRSIYSLKPMQKFHIIFFSSGKPLEGPGGRLVWATSANKRLYSEFIDSVPVGGRTDPTTALRKAIELRPELIYLLTDGVFKDSVTEYIIRLAKENNIKINAIAFAREVGARSLMRIASETGGVYRYVMVQDEFIEEGGGVK